MLSILGHDLRAPIANLNAISSLALDNEISQSEFTTFIHMINAQSNQVLEMLETTLNWAKLNFNTLQQNNVSIEIKDLITAILENHKNTYKSKNITFKVTIDDFSKINSDTEIATIIIRNIVSNAIKFTPQNGIIKIKFSQNELIISDNGIGMTAAMIDDIWNNNNISRRGTENELGMGMGLQLTLNLARKINCKVTIESQQLQGTVFRLLFLD